MNNIYYELDGEFYQRCWNCGKPVAVDWHLTKSDLNRDDVVEEAFCDGKCEREWFLGEYRTLDSAMFAGEEEKAEKFYIRPVKVAVLETIGLTAANIASCEADDTLSVNEGRNGRTYVWYFDGIRNIAADAETGEFLTEEEIEEQFC